GSPGRQAERLARGGDVVGAHDIGKQPGASGDPFGDRGVVEPEGPWPVGRGLAGIRRDQFEVGLPSERQQAIVRAVAFVAAAGIRFDAEARGEGGCPVGEGGGAQHEVVELQDRHAASLAGQVQCGPIMLREQKQALAVPVRDAAASALGDPGAELPEIELDRPKQAEHGDLASNIALQLARMARRKPRDLAEAIRAALLAADGGQLLESAEVAGPGFINLRLTPQARRARVSRVLAEGPGFGRVAPAPGADRKDLVEFVSANPTGPLHVGHGRQAALGDSLCSLLEAAGWTVVREFYYNDAGAQIRNLALSVQARARSIEPDDPRFPADGYRGDYIADIARAYLARESAGAADMEPVVAAGDPDDLEAIRRFAVA